MTRSSDLAFAMSVLVGCAGAPPPSPSAGPARSEPGALAQGVGPLSADRVREIGRSVAALRRLSFAADVPVSFVEARTFEARAAEGMKSKSTDSLLGQLGDESPEESYQVQARYLLAVYSPTRKAVFVRRVLPDGWSAVDLEGLLAHELVHALQFQHFPVDRLLESRKRAFDLDGASALDAYLEGEAELVAGGFAAQRRGGPPRRAMVEAGRERILDSHVFAVAGQVNEALAKASRADQANQLFPYQFGPFFAAALFRTGGTELLDRAWASPPATTREIFDPALYLQSAQKWTLAALPLPIEHEATVSVTLGAVGFYRLATMRVELRAQIPPANTEEEVPPVPASTAAPALLELATHVVADRITFAQGLFGRRTAFGCWVFDGPERAQEAARVFSSPSVVAVGNRVFYAEGAPEKLLVGLPARYAMLPITPVDVGERPSPRPLAPLPDNAHVLLQNARLAADPLTAARGAAGGLRLVEHADAQVLGPGEAWIASHRRGGVTTFLSLLGDGVNESGDLVVAFKRGVVLDKQGVQRRSLAPVENATYTFAGESLQWTGGSALVLDAPACDGLARLVVALVPAPADESAALADVVGLPGLRSSPYCAKVRDRHTNDLP